MFDLHNDFDDVVSFAKRAMIEYSDAHGVASAMLFHVQAVHGSIELYASLSLTLSECQALLETPIANDGDFPKWHDAYASGDVPKYQNYKYDSDLGDGGFNDYVTLMVADAVKEACARLLTEQLPETILVHAAFESAGNFGVELHPRKGEQNAAIDQP